MLAHLDLDGEIVQLVDGEYISRRFHDYFDIPVAMDNALLTYDERNLMLVFAPSQKALEASLGASRGIGRLSKNKTFRHIAQGLPDNGTLLYPYLIANSP